MIEFVMTNDHVFNNNEILQIYFDNKEYKFTLNSNIEQFFNKYTPKVLRMLDKIEKLS